MPWRFLALVAREVLVVLALSRRRRSARLLAVLTAGAVRGSRRIAHRLPKPPDRRYQFARKAPAFRPGMDSADGAAVLEAQSGVRCCSMYWRTMEIGAPPQLDAK